MTPDDIRSAITAQPALRALAAAGRWDDLASQLSAGRTRHESIMVSARGLASRLGTTAAEVILLALESARDVALQSADPAQRVFGSALRRQLGFMAGDGIDFGAPAFLQMVDYLVSLGVWNAQQGAAIKAISRVPDPVTEFEVRAAVFDKQGNLLV